MKALTIGVALLVLGASSAFATNEDRVRAGNDPVTTCWYNDRGDFTGAHGKSDIPFQVNKGTPHSKNAWSYGVPGSGDTCPKKLPNH